MAEVPKAEVRKWIQDGSSESSSFWNPFANDCVEINIRLIQDFIRGYISEDMKQNLMLVARDNRKIMKKDLRKKQLKNLKAFDDENFFF